MIKLYYLIYRGVFLCTGACWGPDVDFEKFEVLSHEHHTIDSVKVMIQHLFIVTHSLLYFYR